MNKMPWFITIIFSSLLLAACGGEIAALEPQAIEVNEEEVNAFTEEVTDQPQGIMIDEVTQDTPLEKTIIEVADEDGRFTTLVAALNAAGLDETLNGEGEYTVFAPTDDAFAALPEGTIASLLGDPQGPLTDILLYHVLEGILPAETVLTLDSATTINGEELSITVNDDQIFLNNEVQVIITNIPASNGIVHVIDGVLLPPGIAEARDVEDDIADESEMEEALPSIAEIAAADGRFSTLVAALDAAGLVETLSTEGEYTVFAPTDEAFAALPEGLVDALLADPQGALSDVLLYHVVGTVVPAETVVTLDSAITLNGEQISFTIVDGEVFLNENAKVIITDIMASNGIIHVIDAVLIPQDLSALEPAESTTETTEEMPSIAEIAAGDEQFSTLVAALDAAGLVDTFAGEGSFTVFAPTNDAFEALPEGTVESLLEDPEGSLTDILTYHVADGVLNAEDVVSLESAPTLLGEDIKITVTDDGELILNDSIQVIMADIEASNGVIHVIDGVLLPTVEESSIAQSSQADEQINDGKSKDPNFSNDMPYWNKNMKWNRNMSQFRGNNNMWQARQSCGRGY